MSVVKSQKAPLEGVNPKQHIVNVVMTDGTKFQILTTWGKEGSTLNLDVDPKNHPAWQDNKIKHSLILTMKELINLRINLILTSILILKNRR